MYIAPLVIIAEGTIKQTDGQKNKRTVKKTNGRSKKHFDLSTEKLHNNLTPLFFKRLSIRAIFDKIYLSYIVCGLKYFLI